jgi:metacaspase-1
MTSKLSSPAKKHAALSLHVGLNAVNPAAYEGWDGLLKACEFDANDMAALAMSQGIKPTVLLTEQATREKLLEGVRTAAKALKSGDLFLLSYSGHGGQVPDIGDEELDKQDETWCLYDGQLIDDELYFELSKFAAGVRILVFSDSCHSGTVTRDRLPTLLPDQRSKLMPASVARRVFVAHKAFYENLQREVLQASGNAVIDPDTALAQIAYLGAAAQAVGLVGCFKPAVMLISGCQDNQTSMDGAHNGAFTEQLLKVWNHGNCVSKNYANFHARIKAGLPANQTPNLFTLGKAASFLAQKPFTV